MPTRATPARRRAADPRVMDGMGLALVAFLSVVGGGETGGAGSSGGGGETCEDARLKCAFRSGCGKALQTYLIDCSGLLRHTPGSCPEICQHALIALTSTEQGKKLMTCQCSEKLCRETKELVEVCRPDVIKATLNETAVSCDVARWICEADSVCSHAFKYYNWNCRSMFAGKNCTRRCRNSIDILRRQRAAAKLDSCVCNGKETYDCLNIKKFTAERCYLKKPVSTVHGDIQTNVVPTPPSKDLAPALHSLYYILFVQWFFLLIPR